MGRKILAISLLFLVVVLAFSACEGGLSPLAQEITDGAVQALDSIISYRFELTSTMDLTGEIEGEATEGELTIFQTSELDLANHKMHNLQTMVSAMTGTRDINTTTETYIIDNTVYAVSDSSYPDITWTKTEIAEELWEQLNQINFELDILEASTKVKVTGSETVDGVDCYVLEITPSEEHLWQLLIQQMGMASDTSTDVSEELLDELFHNYTAKQWIAKDSYFLIKMEVEMSVTLPPELTGNPDAEGETNIDTKLTVMTYDYNQPLSIELPQEAEEAIEY